MATQYEDVHGALQICDELVLDSITVPAGRTLALNLRAGSNLTFRGHIIFEHAEWEGPLVEINGTDVTIQGEQGALSHLINFISIQTTRFFKERY